MGGAKDVAIPPAPAPPRAEKRAALLPAEKWLLALLFRDAPGSDAALRELEAKALRKPRHPSRSRKLKAFLEGSRI